MVEGLIAKQEKPSNTEVLGLLMDHDKLHFITNLNDRNVKGLFKMKYFIERFQDIKKDPTEILNECLEEVMANKCSVPKKNGNRADQVVDALKHIIEDENKDDLKSLAQQIKS